MSTKIFNLVSSVMAPLSKLLLYGSFSTWTLIHQCVLYSATMKFLVQTFMFFNNPIDEVTYDYGQLISSRPILDLFIVV